MKNATVARNYAEALLAAAEARGEAELFGHLLGPGDQLLRFGPGALDQLLVLFEQARRLRPVLRRLVHLALERLLARLDGAQ